MNKILTWDWKGHVSLVELAEALSELTDGKINLYEVDTESDQFAIVLSDQLLDPPAVNQAWEAWLDEWGW